MIASLPMYDWPEVQAANDRLWAGVCQQLSDAPKALGRDISDLSAHWLSPDLFLSQTCSLPYRTVLKDQVQLVGTPVYDLPCEAGMYYSVLITKTAGEPDFDGRRLAINGADSQSGWAALHDHITQHGATPGRVLITGAHKASAQAVAEGHADFAAIDALTWTLIQLHTPFAKQLRVIGRTKPTPALPYICAQGRDPAPIRKALNTAIQALRPDDKHALGLKGVTSLPAELYIQQPVPPAPS